MKLPAFPPRLGRLVSALPTWPPSYLFAAACNRTAWPAVRDLDWSSVIGRRVCVHVSDLGLRLHFSVQDVGLRAEREARADVTYTAKAEDFARLALRLEDPDTLFFNRRLLIEGDTNLGLTMKNLLDSIDTDTIAQMHPRWLGGMVLGWRERLLA